VLWAQHENVLDPQWPVAICVRAGGVLFPGRVEIRDLDDAAQVAGALWVAAGQVIPVVLPERLNRRLKKVLTDIGEVERVFLPESVRVTGAVVADESQPIPADMAHQVC
jgi:hypothetical protein